MKKTMQEKLDEAVGARTWRDLLAICRQHGPLPHPYGLIISGLEAEIGVPARGSHADEAKPRAETWHAERANWNAEVERLRAALAEARAEGRREAFAEAAGIARDSMGPNSGARDRLVKRLRALASPEPEKGGDRGK